MLPEEENFGGNGCSLTWALNEERKCQGQRCRTLRHNSEAFTEALNFRMFRFLFTWLTFNPPEEKVYCFCLLTIN